MKKTILVATVAVLLALSACGDKDMQTPAGTTDGTGTPEVVSTSAVTETGDEKQDLNLRELAPAAVAAGNFGDTMELVYNDDEYAGDLLEFLYGVEADLAGKIDSYVLSEQSGQESYSFAYLKFVPGTSADDISAVKNVINDVYVEGLKASLLTYNPEAYALCEKAVFKEYDDALLLLICEEADVDAVVKVVEGK